MLPTSTDVTIAVRPKIPAGVNAVVAFVMQGAQGAGVNVLAREDHDSIRRLLAAGVIRGKAKEIAFDLVEAGRGKHRRVYAVGLGPEEKLTAEIVRQAAGTLARALRKHRIGRVAIKLPAVEAITPAVAADAIVTGLMLARFRFGEYKGTANKKDADEKDRGLDVVILSDNRNVRDAVERARVIADGQNFARTIASRPGNDINPPSLAVVANQLARDAGLKITVLDEKRMRTLGMGAILAVGSGSA